MNTRRHLLRAALAAVPAALTGCRMPDLREIRRSGLLSQPAAGFSGAPLLVAGRRGAAQQEYRRFLVSGATFRFPAKPAFGMAWTSELQRGYESIKRDPRLGYAVKNLSTGSYLAEFQADRVLVGASMPKPAVSAVLLETRRGNCTREEFQHVVNACDLSINASWRAMLARLSTADERAFEMKYGLPDVPILANGQSPRFYAEFFERLVNYKLDHGCEMLIEACRRNQFGRGRWYLPAEITFVGGKTGTDGPYKHEGLFFDYRGSKYAIVLYSDGHFGRQENFWRIGALFGGLFREYIA
ncbi:MAG: hypothetical protein JNG86_04750 [Verrucomicrobiaceae bacterium]|nr:hypothetical protein [Verrucomicrobiaceae bacterium]